MTRAELVETINAVLQDDESIADVLGGSAGCHDFAEVIADAIVAASWPTVE